MFAVTGLLAASTSFLWKATRDLVEGAEKTGQTQLRAFVFAKGFEQAPNLFYDADGKPFVKDYVFWCPIENVGLTPATDVRVWITSQTFPMSEDIEPHFEWTGVGPGAIVGPRISGQTSYHSIPIAAMVELWENKTAVYLATRIEYRDIFSPSVVHHHEQCAMLGLMRHPADVEPEGQKNLPRVTIRTYGPQNTVA